MRNSLKRNSTWVVMPAYNAELTLKQTFENIDPEFRNRVILVDDCSSDNTVLLAKSLGLKVITHEKNKGYGGNQKTCYEAALKEGAEVVVMVHPDGQYDPRVVGVMSDLIALGNADFLLGNRIRTRKNALDGGMPKWKYFTNRASTFFENLVLGQTIGDFHSGLRAYSRTVLETIPFHLNSDSFAFDQELLVEAINYNFLIADIPISTKYEPDSSSINVKDSLAYGFGALKVILFYYLHKYGIRKDLRFG